MWKTEIKARTSALPAIAAVLALSSTQALAQQSQPVPSDPAAATSPVVPAAPAATDPALPSTDPTAAAPETSAAPATDTSTTVRKTVKTVKPTKHAAAATPIFRAPARATPVATVKHTEAATSRVTGVANAPATAPTVTKQSAVQPIVDTSARPAPARTAATQPVKKHDNTLPIAGGAIAFLALGGAAVAMTRRRSDDEEEWVDANTGEEPLEAADDRQPTEGLIHEEEPAMVAPSPSAFAWGNEDRRVDVSPRASSMDEADDRLPGESWVQRAYRGPTPNNPSVSLRARLKRAAFFDKRERDVAAGKAEPVEMDAGLPDAMVEERELA